MAEEVSYNRSVSFFFKRVLLIEVIDLEELAKESVCLLMHRFIATLFHFGR